MTGRSWTAWSWGCGWALAMVGVVADPRPAGLFSLASAMVVLGWVVGSMATVDEVRRYRDDRTALALSIAGWSLGLAAVVTAGLEWFTNWGRVGYWGPILATSAGAAIGGALMPLAGVTRTVAEGVRARMSAAFRWGLHFLGGQLAAFHIGFALASLSAASLAPWVGNAYASVPGFVLPAAVCGVLAARWAAVPATPAQRPADNAGAAVSWVVAALIVLWITLLSFPVMTMLDERPLSGLGTVGALSLPLMVSLGLVLTPSTRRAGVSAAVGVAAACILALLIVVYQAVVLHEPSLFRPPLLGAVPLLVAVFVCWAAAAAWRECERPRTWMPAAVSALSLVIVLLAVYRWTSAFVFVSGRLR